MTPRIIFRHVQRRKVVRAGRVCLDCNIGFSSYGKSILFKSVEFPGQFLVSRFL